MTILLAIAFAPAAVLAGIRFGAVAGHLFLTVAGLNDGIGDLD